MERNGYGQEDSNDRIEEDNLPGMLEDFAVAVIAVILVVK